MSLLLVLFLFVWFFVNISATVIYGSEWIDYRNKMPVYPIAKSFTQYVPPKDDEVKKAEDDAKDKRAIETAFSPIEAIEARKKWDPYKIRFAPSRFRIVNNTDEKIRQLFNLYDPKRTKPVSAFIERFLADQGEYFQYYLCTNQNPMGDRIPISIDRLNVLQRNIYYCPSLNADLAGEFPWSAYKDMVIAQLEADN